MKNALRIVAVALPLLCSANLAMAEATVQEVVMTGSEDNIREFLGLPPLEGHEGQGAVSGGEENKTTSHGSPRRHRTHAR